jgi:polyphosphate kinase
MTNSPRRPRRSTKIAAQAGPKLSSGKRHVYFNRELSWLAFNRRVLEQAENAANPLLERVKFLAILSSNLDEFFEIRVAGLVQQREGGGEPSIDGLSPREQLKCIRTEVRALVRDQYRCWHGQLVPALAAAGVSFVTAAQLDAAQREWVADYFGRNVQPVLTPLAVDQSHPFPQLGNKTLNLLLSLDNPETPEIDGHLAILPVPRSLPRLVELPANGAGQCFIFLSEVLKLNAGALFPGYAITGAHAFRVTRNSDLYIDEEEAENLLKKIEEELRNLRRGAAVRLEIEDGIEETAFTALLGHLNLGGDDVFRINGPINLLRLMSVYEAVDRPELKYPLFVASESSAIRGKASIFDAIRERDVLLHHPYESFAPVSEFIEEAAHDPQVLAIKQTLYRTSGDSPIVRALSEASRNGKQVTALVELKARFDEANNIKWARELEEAGVHVVYGLVGHKTHCKCALVIRQESDGLRRYVHLGTGNYNPKTARIYTDLSLLTVRPELTAEVAQLFNALTGFGRTPEFRHLLVAPFNLHARIQELIAAEAANAAAGKPARIIAKMNKLVDPVTIDNLYAASQAGVQIDLVVRATCCLAPGIKGQSENIRVRNLVGRFLEHARIYYFENGGQPLLFAGSADWMTRNFFRRVEALFPLYDPEIRQRLIGDLLPAELRDNVDARVLQPDAAYAPVAVAAETPRFSAQGYFMAQAQARREAADAELAVVQD